MPSLFRTTLKQSPIHGVGVFALQDIPKGATHWIWDDHQGKSYPIIGYEGKPNRVLTKQQLYGITDEQELLRILHGGYYFPDSDVFIDLNDGSQYMNHCDDWNSQYITDPSGDYRKMKSIARKDIKAGDQILEYYGNYLSNKAEWVDALMRKMLPDRQQLENHILQSGNKALNWQLQ